MPEPINYAIDPEAWQRALPAIKRQILDAEPVEAMRLIDEMIERLYPEGDRADTSELACGRLLLSMFDAHRTCLRS